MNRKIASTLTVTTTAAAILAVAAIASGNAYADDITIDNTPFVSSKSRAEVQAELMQLGNSSSEWAMQLNEPARPNSAYTSAAAKAEYIASRDEVRAFNSEDSGSSYLATLPRPMGDRVITAVETTR
jgi:hypothetical protein